MGKCQPQKRTLHKPQFKNATVNVLMKVPVMTSDVINYTDFCMQHHYKVNKTTVIHVM